MKFKGIKILTFILVTFLIVISVCGAAEDERVILALPESAEVQGQNILLGAIAEIIGPKESVAEVAKVNAGAAPRPGSSRRLTKGQIEVRLRQAGIDVKKIEFKGATTVQIFGKTGVEDKVTEEKARSGSVYEAVVAKRDLRRGDEIAAEDLEVAEVEIRNNKPDERSLDDFVGLRASRTILQGKILTDLNVEVIPVIERGADVTIIVQTSALVVTAPGVAKDSGGVGEIIAVENTLSKQVIQAEIIDGRTVLVNVRGSGTP